MIKVTFLLFSFLLTDFLNAQQTKKELNKPNIIIINMDDMGYGDTEPYGSTGYATPNFNRLAKEGMRFTHFYAAQAVCSPSRAALLTGCYPNRIGMSGGALMPWSTKALNTSEETIASLLKKAGYTTGMLGKWHLGCKPPFLPFHFGFDSFYGIPYSHDMWPVDYEGKPITDTANWRMKFPPLPVFDGDKQVSTIATLEQQSTLTTTLTEKAEQFITKIKTILSFYTWLIPCRMPLAVSKKFSGKTGAGLFGDVISEIDWSVGRVLDVLDKTELSKNTLLIVTSDNGPWLSFGNHAGSSGGLREGKGTAWDGGTRIPCFIRWPGKSCSRKYMQPTVDPDGYFTDNNGSNECTNAQTKIDGLNFLPLLTGKSIRTPRELFYVYYDVNNLKLIRYKHWELVLPHTSQAYTQGSPGKDGKLGPTPVVEVPMALYDLRHDPGTVYDVQKQYPEIVEEILKYAELAREDLGDDLTQRKGKNIREAAKVL